MSLHGGRSRILLWKESALTESNLKGLHDNMRHTRGPASVATSGILVHPTRHCADRQAQRDVTLLEIQHTMKHGIWLPDPEGNPRRVMIVDRTNNITIIVQDDVHIVTIWRGSFSAGANSDVSARSDAIPHIPLPAEIDVDWLRELPGLPGRKNPRVVSAVCQCLFDEPGMGPRHKDFLTEVLLVLPHVAERDDQTALTALRRFQSDKECGGECIGYAGFEELTWAWETAFVSLVERGDHVGIDVLIDCLNYGDSAELVRINKGRDPLPELLRLLNDIVLPYDDYAITELILDLEHYLAGARPFPDYINGRLYWILEAIAALAAQGHHGGIDAVTGCLVDMPQRVIEAARKALAGIAPK